MSDFEDDDLQVIDLANDESLIAMLKETTAMAAASTLTTPDGDTFRQFPSDSTEDSEESNIVIEVGQVWRNDAYSYKIISTEPEFMLEGHLPSIVTNRSTSEKVFGALPLADVNEGRVTILPVQPYIKEDTRWINVPSGMLAVTGGPGDVKVKLSASCPADISDIIGYLIRQ